MIVLIATFGIASVYWPKTASAAESDPDQQIILAECPVWNWESSDIPGVGYELCFDDVDHCTTAGAGDSVCIPGMGQHEVWVTAIDYRSGTPVYYDGDVAPISRTLSADFNGNGLVGFMDFFIFINALTAPESEVHPKSKGQPAPPPEDMNGDGVLSIGDLFLMLDAFGSCISSTGSLYEAC
jgi:hypothetical protein